MDLSYADRDALHRLRDLDGLFEQALLDGSLADIERRALAVCCCWAEAAAFLERTSW
jgi:hypothetical protein